MKQSILNMLSGKPDAGEDAYLDQEELLEEQEYEEEEPSKEANRGEGRTDEAEEKKAPKKVGPKKTIPARGSLVSIKPKNLEDRKLISDYIKNSYVVLIDYTGLSDDLMERISDYVCGVAYSLDFHFKLVTNKIYVITPHEMEISGDFLV